MHWTVVSQVRQTGRAVARPCDKLATAGGDGDQHVGITPVRITGVLVCFFCPQNFGNGYLGRGLTQGDEILQDGRSRSPPGLLPFW